MFDGRVRDGIGSGHRFMATEKTGLLKNPRAAWLHLGRSTVRQKLHTISEAIEGNSTSVFAGDRIVSSIVASPIPCRITTIGPEGLNDRIRNGIGCDPLGMSTPEYQMTIALARRAFQKKNRGQAARPISTAWLSALQRLHLRPINLVVYQGP